LVFNAQTSILKLYRPLTPSFRTSRQSKSIYNLGIPFSQKVYIAQQPDTAFVLTWKMVIKYSHRLFWANDQTVWDKTLNWKLEFHHDGEFTFGKDLIYDGQLEMQKNKVKLETALKEMEERKKRNSFE
jgi:hypothetical protein